MVNQYATFKKFKTLDTDKNTDTYMEVTTLACMVEELQKHFIKTS